MEFVMFLTTLLFTGGCTLILVVAAFHINTDRERETSLDDTNTETSFHDRKTLV
jgi:hypothetical protein